MGGHCSMVWDTPLPHSRSFSDMVARAFASKLKELRFSRFEWWNGKGWKEMPGRYVILHDTKYDKYTLRVRCHWPDDCEPEELGTLVSLSLAAAETGARRLLLMRILHSCRWWNNCSRCCSCSKSSLFSQRRRRLKRRNERERLRQELWRRRRVAWTP